MYSDISLIVSLFWDTVKRVHIQVE